MKILITAILSFLGTYAPLSAATTEPNAEFIQDFNAKIDLNEPYIYIAYPNDRAEFARPIPGKHSEEKNTISQFLQKNAQVAKQNQSSKDKSCVILKLDTAKLVGLQDFEKNLDGTLKFNHIENIPLDAVVDVTVIPLIP